MDMIRILAVDDEPDLRSLLRILLKNRGYEVLEAASGMEAVELVRSEPRIDLVIMDIMMPGLNGVEACAEIRKFSTVPMLFLTAKSQLADKAEAYASGGDDYLAKPFSQNEKHTCAIRNGQRIDLTDKEFAILRFFVQNRGRTVDVQKVYESVWGEKYLPSSNNTVMVHILNLRKKLEADPANPKLIRTVWGKGYQFG